MKSEKGLTFLSTAILVLVIALTVFGGVYFVRLQANKQMVEDTKTNMLLVQAKAKYLAEQRIIQSTSSVLVGTKLGKMKEDETIKKFLEMGLFDPDVEGKKYYVLNQEDLNSMELEKITLKDGDYYIVEYISGEVYCTAGYVDENGEVQYKLVEPKVEENKEEDSEQNQ